MADIERLQQTLGYQFRNIEILQLALTHRSAGGRNNERLEFLGDSILNHIIAEALYHQFPKSREGELSRMRARLVKGETLAEVATELDLADYLVLGSGERKAGGHRRGSIRADAVEAVIGAILLDGGQAACRDRVLHWYASRLAALSAGGVSKDPKTRLQEYLQGRGLALPLYEQLAIEGEDHVRRFHVGCRLESPALLTEGRGSSRRKAEQAAAREALVRLGVLDGGNA
ncbi:MAG: ribonuclease III [Halioglobus sp.]|nr:ribonuclease III [Halioglobus sp.]